MNDGSQAESKKTTDLFANKEPVILIPLLNYYDSLGQIFYPHKVDSYSIFILICQYMGEKVHSFTFRILGLTLQTMNNGRLKHARWE
jgi:hypothetical protein